MRSGCRHLRLFKNERAVLRPFCSSSSSGTVPSFLRERILLRREHFNSNRLRALGRNEKGLFAERRPVVVGTDCATLVLICRLGSPPGEESWILFTQRAKKMSEHANEISFPGGRIDQEESVETAAIREAEEEIGLDTTNLEVWGTLRPLPLRNMAGVVTPVVAAIGDNVVEQRLSALKCADAEVQNIFVASVGDLLARVRYTTFRLPGKLADNGMPFYYQMPIFHAANPRLLCSSSSPSTVVERPEKFRIWGLTALTLLEAFCSLLPEGAKERRAIDLLKTTKTSTE
uniref:Nudix hydrolase domain-containing protein n=1 Tax=Globodera rostochiensis TaxID=31243 RepID=A0A914HKA9_GLORO